MKRVARHLRCARKPTDSYPWALRAILLVLACPAGCGSNKSCVGATAAPVSPDRAALAVTVRAVFPNDGRKLRPGMLLDVRLFRPERQALVIPEIAVVQVGRDSFVYRVKADGSVEQAAVTAGVRRDGQVEIVKGVAAGDRIVIDGTGKLRPGVKVADAAAAAPAKQDAPAADGQG